jgi:hypothetical protein
MPRIDKNISTNSSSEIVSSVESDSEASSSTESNYGSGDEGTPNTTINITQNNTTKTATCAQSLLLCSIKLITGLSCPLIAVSSAVNLIYFGIQLNNPNSGSRNADSAAFAASAVLTVVGSVSSYLIHAKSLHSSTQVPNA